MYDNLYKIIKKNEIIGDFTYAKVNEETLTEAESELGIIISDAYKWFLKKFGHGSIGGIEILGVGKNGKMAFVSETLKYRSYGLPKDLIVIENCDEWVYCLDSKTNKVVMWSQGELEGSVAYQNFEIYLLDRINDMIENM